MDKISGVDQGKIRFLRQRSRDFRQRVLEQKAARLTDAAIDREEAERAEAAAEAQRLADERANRKPGTYEDGRARFANKRRDGIQGGEE